MGCCYCPCCQQESKHWFREIALPLLRGRAVVHLGPPCSKRWCGDLPFPEYGYPHWWRPRGNVLLLSSREPTPDSPCSGCCVFIKDLLFPAEYEAAMDRRFGLDPGTLFRGLKKVGRVTASRFVSIVVPPCPLCIQASDLALEFYSNMQIWIFIVNFSLLFWTRTRDCLGVSGSKNHNQSFVPFLDHWLKCISLVTSLDNPLFYFLPLKPWSTLTLPAAFSPFFLLLGDLDNA